MDLQGAMGQTIVERLLDVSVKISGETQALVLLARVFAPLLKEARLQKRIPTQGTRRDS